MGVGYPKMRKTRLHQKRDLETYRRAPAFVYLTKLECEFCGRAFMTEDALTRHIERKHSEVFQCLSS